MAKRLPYLSVAQAAKMLNVTRGRIQQLIDDGHFPGIQQIGKGFLLPIDEVEDADQRPKKPGWPKGMRRK